MTEEHKKHHGGHHHKKTENLTISKVTLWKIIAGVLGILLVLSMYSGGFGINSISKEAPMAQPEQKEQQKEQPSEPSTGMEALMEDDAVEGDKDAPVTIVEWSDYECPFCARFYSQTLSQIRKEYVEKGLVKIVFRDFPLNFHANAKKAAEAAECAGEQEKYYEMHDRLFESGVKGGVATFKKYAEEIGLDTDEFNECLDTNKMAAEVAKDMKDGSNAGIRGTPGFIINGQAVSGAQPFSVFKEIIDAELAK